MRTNLTIDDDLMKELRKAARRRKLPLSRLVNQLLRAGLRSPPRPATTKRYRCPTFSMGSPRPGIPDLVKALAIASALEDEEVVRKLMRSE